jgi:hypothetical protein
MAFTAPQFSTLHTVEELVEVLNNEWKVNSIESGHSCYYQVEAKVGRKYTKLMTYLVSGGVRQRGRSAYMFVDNTTGACYKPASVKAPAKGIRCYIDQLADHPEACDQYGSFLYRR